MATNQKAGSSNLSGRTISPSLLNSFDDCGLLRFSLLCPEFPRKRSPTGNWNRLMLARSIWSLADTTKLRTRLARLSDSQRLEC
jgi:hypothetical protein